MKLSFFVFIAGAIHHVVFTQIIESPKYSFEKMVFGVKMTNLKINSGWSEYNDEKTDAVMAKYSPEKISLVYCDTSEPVQPIIRLMFNKNDSTLSSVLVQFSSAGHNFGKNTNEKIHFLWNEYTSRFGAPQKERTMPMFGTVRKWLLGTTSIVAIHSDDKEDSLTITYAYQ